MQLLSAAAVNETKRKMIQPRRVELYCLQFPEYNNNDNNNDNYCKYMNVF